MTEQQIKDAVRERDGQQCVHCGMTAEEHQARYGKALDVHRRIPGSVYSVRGCETVCRGCHGPLPKRPRRSPRLAHDPHQGRTNLNVWIPEDLAEAFDELRARTRRSITAEMQVMFERHFAKAGLWPPK